MAIYECYLSEIQSLPGGLIEVTILSECEKLQSIENNFNLLVFLQGKSRVEGLTEDQREQMEMLVQTNSRIWEDVITYDNLQLLPRKVDDDVFFEKLIEYTNRAAFRLQKIEREAENIEKRKLIGELLQLKKNFTEKFEEICEIETRLSLIEEKINQDKVENYLKFDLLNNEKITPHFLRIAKMINSVSLEKIGKPNGERFERSDEREEYIFQFIKDLYSLPDTMLQDFTGCIERFLGPDICAHDTVRESKLDEQEKNLLDQPLTIAELDASVKTLNLKSALGIDGVSNRFIAKFWVFLREPLHRYVSTCVQKGTLTDTFSTAIIRLIPKKGNTTLLSNWRPISLLSCYY